MAKRELSNTLKNLKFMQRGSPKVEKPKEEEVKPDGNFVSPSNVNRKCVVIMEGDPHPGTVRGRMSFQKFNPSIDKLSEDATCHDTEAPSSSGVQSDRNLDRENGISEQTEVDMDIDDGKLKRKQKQHEAGSQASHPKKKKKSQGDKQPSQNENGSSNKKKNNGNVNWNVLLSPGSQSRRK